MREYLYGEKDGVHIFDLTQTKALFEEALAFLSNAAKEGKTILFIGTKKQAKEKIAEVAKATKSFYVKERWLGGTLSNFEQIKKSVRKLADLKKGLASGEFNGYTKKERLLLEREMLRLESIVGGLTDIEKRPDILIVVDTKKEFSVIREAKKLGTTIVALVDSNANPDDIDYVIPMNDDATRAVDYALELMRDAILEGKNGEAKKEKAEVKKVEKKETVEKKVKKAEKKDK
jgi:small subunit ribosomal protein S2